MTIVVKDKMQRTGINETKVYNEVVSVHTKRICCELYVIRFKDGSEVVYNTKDVYVQRSDK